MDNPDFVLTLVLVTMLILLLVAGITISFFVISKQKTKQQMILTETQLKYEKELRQVEVEVSEKLMENFARELHDNLGHQITCIRLSLENQKLDHPQLVNNLDAIGKHVSAASDQLKLLSRSLNSEYIKGLGLIDAIQLEIERQAQLGKINIHWEHLYINGIQNRNQELILFRILQEAINNALNYSEAKNLVVRLENENRLFFQIRDDGKGFDFESIIQSSKASGLKNIVKRAELAGFKSKIKSSPGNGCSIIISSKEM